jgi:hypothetical protein
MEPDSRAYLLADALLNEEADFMAYLTGMPYYRCQMAIEAASGNVDYAF